MTKLLLLGTIASSAVLAAPALAADFTGPRIEVHAGWDRLSADDPDLKLDAREDGITYGIGIGYDFALSDRVIAGIEANADLSDVEFEQTIGNTLVEAEPKRDFDIAARIGAKIADNVLIYAKGGYTNAKFKGAVTVGGTTGTTRTEFSDTLDGWRLGGGVEVAFTDSLYAKAEYRYSDYEGGLSRNQVLTGIGFRF